MCGALEEARNGAVAERELARNVLAELSYSHARGLLENFVSDLSVFQLPRLAHSALVLA